MARMSLDKGIVVRVPTNKLTGGIDEHQHKNTIGFFGTVTV